MGLVWEKPLLIEPRLADLNYANGVVVTEFGNVPVSWKKTHEGNTLDFSFSIPSGTTAIIHLPTLSKKNTLVMNGKLLVKNGIPQKEVLLEGRWIVVKGVSGKCSGSVTAN